MAVVAQVSNVGYGLLVLNWNKSIMNMSEINIAIKKIRKNIFGAMCDQDVVGMVIPDIGF